MLILIFKGAIAYVQAQFGAGSGPVLLSNVECSAEDQRLIDCPASIKDHESICGHEKDAGVRCKGIFRYSMFFSSLRSTHGALHLHLCLG